MTSEGIGFAYVDVLEKSKATLQPQDFISWQFTQSNGQKFLDFIMEKIPSAQLVECFGNSWKIKMDKEDFTIGYLFGLMEDNKAQFEVSEYSVSQTTLEQIFNHFAASAELKQ